MIDSLSIFLGGENRITLPFLAYPPLFLSPIVPLAALIIIPNAKLPTIAKQILSIPLLLALFLIPFGFTNGNRVIDLVAGVLSYNLFLRFLELYWVGPMVQDRPAYTTVESLWIDFWGCIRTFPQPAKEDTKDLKKGEVKVYKKDQKFYHIILKLLGSIIVTDVVGSYMNTFTGTELAQIYVERPAFFLVIFIFVNIVLNGAFNSFGYSMQLFYCLAFEGGSYSSEQWRPLMVSPIISSSLDNLWSFRWHQLFKSTWLAFPFRPVRILTDRLLTKKVKNSKSIAFVLASVAVFVASALMHEYVIAANMGWPIYSRFYMGEQVIFFVGHGLGAMVENMIKMSVAKKLPKSFTESVWCKALQHIWVIVFGYLSFIYIMRGFMTWGFHHDTPLTFTRPWLNELIRSNPALLPYVGGNVPF
ncbi:hypothetical protein HPULCUR_009465 [Helicostylum pulchrum]|uniref:Wax synthase domain-containing protein n=1 Tax=Helicostylum pulchrum TaxID=562976 RepID=A0ABP9YB41_9FUNG